MTTPEINPEQPAVPAAPGADANGATAAAAALTTPEPDAELMDERKRRSLLLILLLLLLCLCCVVFLAVRYLIKPQPLPALLPTQLAPACYAPAYKYSINNIDGPVAVVVSPDGRRIYAAESKGDRLVKIFDRNGSFLNSFSPPGTDKANRDPKYMAIDPQGRVYVVDRTSNAIDIYDADGKFIDAIISQRMTLSKFLASKIGAIPPGTLLSHYEGINRVLSYQLPDKGNASVKITFPVDEPAFAPLGLRFDTKGDLFFTDITNSQHAVYIIPAADLNGNLAAFNPNIIEVGGVQGQEKGQLDFPQVAVTDSTGNYYVSDGNNARITVFSADGKYKTFFGFGSASGALNLPRGMWITSRNCLNVADAVGGVIRVYDVSGAEAKFAVQFGGYGLAEGNFNYPMDVFLDGTGRLYVADRDNNRIQVWSY